MVICLERDANAYGPHDATATPLFLALFRLSWIRGH